MASPNRRAILADLESTLKGIRIANGYRSDIATVELVARTFAEARAPVRPYIGIVPGRESWAYQPFACVRVDFTVQLVCHVQIDRDRDLMLDALNDLLDDIVAVLSVDTTRGGSATMTTVSTVESDEGAPEGGASMVIGLSVVYFRTTGATP